jgi:hypothetical protein
MSYSFAPASAANDAANWVDRVIARRRGRRMATTANAIKHAGLIVSELRGLRNNMKSLFVPLEAFNPADWPPERRVEEIKNLIEFSAVAPTLGYLSQDAYALARSDLTELVRALPAEELAEEDPVILRDRLVELTWDISHVGESAGVLSDEDEIYQDLQDRVTELGWDTELDEYMRRGSEDEGGARVEIGPDMLIQHYLPALIWLVRNADSDHMEQTRALRKLARDLSRTRSRSGSVSLELVVREAESILGRFVGLAEKAYPEMPPPTWASERAR